MDVLNAYFGDIVFFKAEQKENFTIYAAALASSFGDGRKQYALAFVPTHMAILKQGHLKDLHWQNIQTRTLTNGWKMKAQRWDIPKGLPLPMFTIVDRNANRSSYVCKELSLEMVLLHDPKKTSKFQYHNAMNLLAALVSFRCVINVIDDRHVDYTSMTNIQGRDNFHQSQVPEYAGRGDHLPDDTSYVPRNQGTGTKYMIGNTGECTGASCYTRLDLNIDVPGSESYHTSGEVIDSSFEFI